MTLATLKAVCAAYHKKATADLTVNAVDLFLVAVNNARKAAERLHNFEHTRVSATLVVDGVTGGALSGLLLTPLGVYSGLKEITSASRLHANGSYVPLNFTRADIVNENERSLLTQDNSYYDDRYPSDASFLSSSSDVSLVQRGGSIYFYPRISGAAGTTTEVTIEGFGWLRDYVASDLSSSSATDFFVEHGFDFLQWATIIELNHYFKTFVPRQEGNLSAPEQRKEEAWRSLLLWDSYLVDSHITR